MDKLPMHVKRTFFCENCDRVYPIRYMGQHHRTYKHQRNLLILENVFFGKFSVSFRSIFGKFKNQQKTLRK